MRNVSIAFLALLVPFCPVWAQADTPPVQEVLTVEEVGFDEKVGRFYMVGRCALAEQVVVRGSVIFAGVAGQFVRGTVKDQQYRLEFEPMGQKQVLPGTYQLQAEVRPEDQAPELGVTVVLTAAKDIQIGTPEKQAEEVARMKKELLELTENCRRLFIETEGKASYILLGIDRKKKAGKLTDKDKGDYLNAWSSFAGVDRYWMTTFSAIRKGYNDYHDYIFLSYYPNVEQSLRAVLETLEKWVFSYWHDICLALDVEIPQEIKERGQFFDRASVESSLASSVNEIYSALQVEAMNWRPVTLWDSEDGTIVKNTYTSKTTTFEITRPNDQWDFKILSEDPVLRLRIEPHDGIRAAQGYAMVEVKDFPDAKGPKDLAELVELTAHDRYPSYKKVEGKSISVPDPNFPGGKRPGYDLVFQYESNNVKYKARTYELFCGTFKRTYAVVCIGYQEKWTEFETEFDGMCKSFKVLKQALPETQDNK